MQNLLSLKDTFPPGREEEPTSGPPTDWNDPEPATTGPSQDEPEPASTGPGQDEPEPPY